MTQRPSSALNTVIISIAVLVIGISIYAILQKDESVETQPLNTQTNTIVNSPIEGPINAGAEEGESLTIGCSTDSDCIVWGCSAHLCGRKIKVDGVATTCEYKDAYACVKQTTCGCTEGECRWDPTDAYVACLDRARAGG
ncbi:MAG: eight-cysteine-cluster domain-containing protein [Patescibacteria group bacterium]|jgi:eight-cysteine-cluster-containing protein